MPDADPDARLRLTELQEQPTHNPEKQEIDLQKYFPWHMSFECRNYDQDWVWGVDSGSVETDTNSASAP